MLLLVLLDERKTRHSKLTENNCAEWRWKKNVYKYVWSTKIKRNTSIVVELYVDIFVLCEQLQQNDKQAVLLAKIYIQIGNGKLFFLICCWFFRCLFFSPVTHFLSPPPFCSPHQCTIGSVLMVLIQLIVPTDGLFLSFFPFVFIFHNFFFFFVQHLICYNSIYSSSHAFY